MIKIMADGTRVHESKTAKGETYHLSPCDCWICQYKGMDYTQEVVRLSKQNAEMMEQIRHRIYNLKFDEVSFFK